MRVSLVAGVGFLLASVARAECPVEEPILGDLVCTDVVSGDLWDDPVELDWRYLCGEPYGALFQLNPEHLYTYVCTEVGDLTIQVSSVCDLDLYVLDSSCDPELGCLAGSTAIDPGGAEVQTACSEVGELLYVIVEGYGLDDMGCEAPIGGHYTLSFALDVGVCETEVILQEPVPGAAGVDNTFRATGVTPEEVVHFVVGWPDGASEVPGCPGVVLPLGEARVLGTARASTDGEAQIVRHAPAWVEGQTMVFAAVEVGACVASPGVEVSW